MEPINEIRRVPTKKVYEQEKDEAGDSLVVVYFTAEWCSQTESVTSQIQELLQDPEFAEVIFLEVDVDDNAETAASCDIDFPPTLQFYRYQEKVAELRNEDIGTLKFVLQLHR